MSGICYADPFMLSNDYPVGVVQPTSCYVYLNGEAVASLQSLVGTKIDGSVYCRVDLAPMPAGIYTAEITAVLGTGESPRTNIGQVSKHKVEDVGSPWGWKYQIGTEVFWMPK